VAREAAQQAASNAKEALNSLTAEAGGREQDRRQGAPDSSEAHGQPEQAPIPGACRDWVDLHAPAMGSPRDLHTRIYGTRIYALGSLCNLVVTLCHVA